MSLTGKWRITQHWPQKADDPFTAEFKSDGAITVDLGTFWGIWSQPNPDVNFAITDLIGQTMTLYQGQQNGNSLNGTAIGHTHLTGSVTQGTWEAVPA